jgi:hypothetical protein
MWKAALAGALTLATGMTSLAVADTLNVPQAGYQQGAGGPAIKESHIARLRAALNLKPEQQRYWGPVESALRALARQQSRVASAGGFVSRMSDRATGAAATAIYLRRLSSAAGPLIRVLDETQKQRAMSFVNSSGFGHLAAAF